MEATKPTVVVCRRMSRWLLVVVLLAASACGGKGANSGGEKQFDFDGDPLALLPPAPIVLARADARAVFDSGGAGAEVAALARKLVPLGEQSGFQATRDVDGIVVAEYATGGVDFAAVLSGRFDPAKIAQATTASNGVPIVRAVYAGHTTYSVDAIQYSVLTSRTLVAGSGDGVRRLLERLSAGPLERSMAPWMADTVETKGAEVALAADFDTQPIAFAALGAVNLPWLNGMRIARVIGNFEASGMNVAATLTYGDPRQTLTAADGVRSIDGLLRMIGPLLGGVRLRQLEVTAEGRDLRCKFALDDETLRTILALAPRFLPMTP